LTHHSVVMQQVLLLVKQRLQPLAKAAFEQLGKIV
jgi:hypothetical protein